MTDNNRSSNSPINSHASVQVRRNERADVGGVSFLGNRDDDFFARIETESNNATSLVVRMENVDLRLTGRQARTLQRLLNKHYRSCGRSNVSLGADVSSLAEISYRTV